jgi:hypothetical protein
MNSMNMPGFSAEASLYRSVRQYRMAGTRKPGSRGVLPQLPIGFCMADCDFTEHDPLSNAACKFDCLGQDGGGPGRSRRPGVQAGLWALPQRGRQKGPVEDLY